MKSIFLLIALTLAFCCNSFAQSFYIKHNITLPGNAVPGEQIEFGKFNNDSYTDMFAMDAVTSKLLVYVNNAGVIDSVPQQFATVNYYNASSYGTIPFRLLDWNNDGYTDVVYSVHDSVWIMLNNGAGSFGNHFLNVDSINIGGARIADVNHDTYPDIYGSSTGGGLCVVLNNAGNINSANVFRCTVLTSSTHPFESSPYCLSDFNKTGTDELAVAYDNGSFKSIIYIYKNNGNFNFSITDSISWQGTPIRTLRTQDLNKDGVEEIVGVDENDSLFVFQKNGAHFKQVYAANVYYFFNNSVKAVGDGLSFYDLDGNGYTDIIFVNTMIYNGNMVFTPKNVLLGNNSDGSLIGARFADTNNDNKAEIWWMDHQFGLYPAAPGIDQVSTSTYKGSQSFGVQTRMWEVYPGSSGGATPGPLFADMNNDGNLDFVYQSDKYVVVSVNQGDFTFKEIPIIRNYYNEQYYLHDFNNDSLVDYIGMVSITTDKHIDYYTNQGGLKFQLAQTIKIEAIIIGIADFDHDGKDDILLDSSNVLIILKNTGTGFVRKNKVYTLASNFGGGTFSQDILDVNNDGLPDYVYSYSNSSGSSIYSVINNGNFTFTEHASSAGNLTWVGFTDVNGDGFKDLVIGSFPGSSASLRVVLNDKTGVFKKTVFIEDFTQHGFHGGFLTDANNDGQDDYVYAWGPTNVELNTGNGFSNEIPQGQLDASLPYSQTPNARPYEIDFDKDGDKDLFFSTGFWLENVSVSAFSITGKVFNDKNSNGVQDAGDVGVPYFPVVTTPFGTLTTTDTAGNFNIHLGSNIGNISVSSASQYNSSINFTTNPYPATANISVGQPHSNVNIGINTNENQQVLDLTTSGHKCGGNGKLWIHTENISPLSSAYNLTVKLSPKVSYVSSEITPSSVNGNILQWNNITTSAFQNKTFSVTVLMPSTSTQNDSLIYTASLTATQNANSITVNDTTYEILTCSFDPNTISITPRAGQFTQNKLYYTLNNSIEYLIHFQNTGTDTATNVVITDAMPAYLDPLSIRVVAASNDYAFKAEGNLVTVAFNNINLPDSAQSFTGSMGFVKLTANLLPSAPANTAIIDGASIYFDKNVPVATNDTTFYKANCKSFFKPSFETDGLSSYRCYNASFLSIINNTSGYPATYSWKLDGNTVPSSHDSAFVYVSTAGAHLLEVSMNLYGCISDSVFSFTATSTPKVLKLNYPDTISVCAGNTVILQSNLGTAYWYVKGVQKAYNSSYSIPPGQTVVARYATSFTGYGCSSLDTVTAILSTHQQGLVLGYPLSSYDYNVCTLSGAINLNSVAVNTVWDYKLNGGTDVVKKQKNISVPIDGSLQYGVIYATLDSVGCNFNDTFNIIVRKSDTIQLHPNLSVDTICNTSNAYIYSVSSAVGLDSLQVYNSIFGGQHTYITKGSTLINIALTGTGSFIITGFYGGCQTQSTNIKLIYKSLSLVVDHYGTYQVCPEVGYGIIHSNHDSTQWIVNDTVRAIADSFKALPGQYVSVLYASHGCVANNTVTVQLVNNYPTIFAVSNAILVTGNYMGSWYYSTDSANFVFLADTNVISYPSSGYYYFVRTVSGCNLQSNVVYFLATSVSSAQESSPVLYYNASDNTVVIKGFNQAGATLLLFDEMGRKLCSLTAKEINQLPLLSSGIYFACLVDDNKVAVSKIVKP